MSMELTPEERQAIGTRMRGQREILDLTQAELGHRVHVTQPTVSAWEAGEKLPRLFLQHAVADALRTRRSVLFRELAEAESRAIA